MSEIAARSMQKESIDVNNLWKWPTTGSPSPSYSPAMDVTVSFWKWLTRGAFYNGYLNYTPHSEIIGDFTNETVTCLYVGGYVPATFVDLAPGSYVFSGNTSTEEADILFYTMQYRLMSNGKYVFVSGKKTNLSVRDGFFEAGFEVNDGCCVCIGVGPANATDSAITFTSLKIREGVL